MGRKKGPLIQQMVIQGHPGKNQTINKSNKGANNFNSNIWWLGFPTRPLGGFFPTQFWAKGAFYKTTPKGSHQIQGVSNQFGGFSNHSRVFTPFFNLQIFPISTHFFQPPGGIWPRGFNSIFQVLPLVFRGKYSTQAKAPGFQGHNKFPTLFFHQARGVQFKNFFPFPFFPHTNWGPPQFLAFHPGLPIFPPQGWAHQGFSPIFVPFGANLIGGQLFSQGRPKPQGGHQSFFKGGTTLFLNPHRQVFSLGLHWRLPPLF